MQRCPTAASRVCPQSRLCPSGCVAPCEEGGQAGRRLTRVARFCDTDCVLLCVGGILSLVLQCGCEKPPRVSQRVAPRGERGGPALASTHRTHTHTLARTVHLTSIPNRRARRAAADRVFKKRDLYFCIGIGLTPLTHFASVAVLRSQCIRVPITVITLHRPVLSLRWWSSRQWVSLLPS
jgi:hypothetical protein